MELKEITEFIDRTLDKWRYSTADEYSYRERCFSQMLKISEETWELSEQVLWKFGWQRVNKADKISEEKLKNEIADVIFSTVRLARLMDLDVEELLSTKMEILKDRFNQN